MRSLAPDEFMNMIQLNIIGGGVQSYSKQLDGVQLIASCGAYVNGSLIAFKDGFEEVPADDVYEFEGKKYSRKHLAYLIIVIYNFINCIFCITSIRNSYIIC